MGNTPHQPPSRADVAVPADSDQAAKAIPDASQEVDGLRERHDESVAKVDEKTGVVVAEGSGDTHIVAFYDNGLASVAAMLPVEKASKNAECSGSATQRWVARRL